MVKPIFLFLLLSLCLSNLYAQKGCDVSQFKELFSISKKSHISDTNFNIAIKLLKELEHDKCSDYIGKDDSVISGRTALLGGVCIKKNNKKAIYEYIKYMERHHGSTEEQISFSFERLFVQRPDDVLSIIGFNKDFLDKLEWGFVNNHYEQHLTSKNCKELFFLINPKVKRIYPKYKKEIDYLINSIAKELKG